MSQTNRPARVMLLGLACAALAGFTSCAGTTSSPSPDAGPAPVAEPGNSTRPASSPRVHQFPAPAEFVSNIDNPYLPLEPGTQWVYRTTSSEGSERIVVTVSAKTKQVAGVTATIVRDTVSAPGGKLIEDTWDWYAQDVDGNVWYLGEYTEAYEDGKTSTEGSWEAGKGGARAGIVMLAEPSPGDSYHQEYDKGDAEDYAEVLAVDASATVPFGSYRNMVKTLDVNPFEPKLREHKYYAEGIGFAFEEQVRGGDDRVRLVKMTTR